MKWLAYKDALYNIERFTKIEFYYDDKFSPHIALWIGDILETLRGAHIGITYQSEEEAEKADKNAKLEFYLWIQALDEWFITFEELYEVPPKKRLYKKSMEMPVLPSSQT